MVLAVALAMPESLPAERRHGGGLGRLLGATGEVLSSRVFSGHLVVFAFSMGTTFAYVATSAYVLQSMNGLTPLQYSVDFAANAGGMTVAALVAARYADRVPTRVFVKVGLVATGAAGLVLAVSAVWFSMPLGAALVGLLRPHDRPGTGRPERWRARLRRSPRRTPAPGRRCWASCSGSWPAPSPRWPASAASTPPSRWPLIVLVLTAASAVAYRSQQPSTH